MRRLPAALAAAAAVLVLPVAAWAHVTVDPGEAPKGGTDQEITLRVPNEEDQAATIELDVKIPTDHPLLGVLVEDKPGWKVEVTTTKLAKPVKTDDGTITEAVSEITWSGGRVAPGGYGDFRFLVGQLPDDTDQLVFKAIQTYEGGKESSWIEEPVAEGQPEPEFPAPVLQLVDGAAGEGSGGTTATTVLPVATVDAATKDQVDSAKTVGNAALAIAAVGVLAAGGAILLAKGKGSSGS